MSGRRADTAKTVRWVALLRAINVGGRTVKMDRLRALFEGLGFERVSTFIASGNVLFSASADEARHVERIERHLADSLGFDVTTCLRDGVELGRALRDPFPDEAGTGSRYVAFLRAAPSAEAEARVEALSNETDRLRVIGRDVHWLTRGRFSDSTVTGALLEKTAGVPATVRNVNTVGRLVKKLSA
ncbi:MAG: DUF1697 domain-containing protein [Gemmatimonadota bacterium]|jgi:uncharacterized protein (DUF1697 family)